MKSGLTTCAIVMATLLFLLTAKECTAERRTSVIRLTVRVVENSENIYTYKGRAYSFPSAEEKDRFKAKVEQYGSNIRDIGLEAYQFGFSPERLVVKKNDIVQIHTTSRDTTHSVYITEYGVHTIVKKGEEKKIEFLADKVGEFDIICLIECEPEDIEMKAKLIVEE